MDLNVKERLLRGALFAATVDAALAVAPYRGRGKEYGKCLDGVASEVIRRCLNTQLPFGGRTVIGEGEKDESHGIFYGEHLGPCDAEEIYCLAVDPVEGTTKTTRYEGGAVSIMAAAFVGAGHLYSGRCHYAEKLVLGNGLTLAINKGGQVNTRDGWLDLSTPLLDQPLDRVTSYVADCSYKRVSSLHVVVQDRPRNAEAITTLRQLGVQLELIDSGDVAAAWSVLAPEHPVDMLLGIGGGPETVLTAAMARCYGGYVEARPWFTADEKGVQNREKMVDAGQDPDQLLKIADLAGGSVMFALTAITDGILPGVRYTANGAVTNSVFGRSATGTIYQVQGHHANPPTGSEFD